MIKFLCLALVACSSADAPPNRACVIAHGIEEGTCDDMGVNNSTEQRAVMQWHHEGGIKICIETYDAKLAQPLTCWVSKLSPNEKADQKLARERAQQQAAPPPAIVAPVPPPATRNTATAATAGKK